MVRIIGCGNLFRRDDGAGAALAERLRAKEPQDAEIVTARGEGFDLLESIVAAPWAIIVDAMRSGRRPGTIVRLDGLGLRERGDCPSSHGFGVAHALALSRVLGVPPVRIDVYGIEGEDFGPGEGLTPSVSRAVDRLARRLYTLCTNKGS